MAETTTGTLPGVRCQLSSVTVDEYRTISCPETVSHDHSVVTVPRVLLIRRRCSSHYAHSLIYR